MLHSKQVTDICFPENNGRNFSQPWPILYHSTELWKRALASNGLKDKLILIERAVDTALAQGILKLGHVSEAFRQLSLFLVLPMYLRTYCLML